jgi:F-type H+-transporting ATPase subunit c
MRILGTVALCTLALLLLPFAAGAEEAAGAVAAAAADTNSWGYALGAGIAIGFGALGCGIGQGLTAGNTTAGIARNPGAAGSMFTNFILGMVLIESISIYALVIGFMLVLSIP